MKHQSNYIIVSAHSGSCPFGIVLFRDRVPFGMVSHSGWCPIRDGAPFGMVPIRKGAHSGWCTFGMVSIRDCVPFGIVFRDRVQDPITSRIMVETVWGVV